MNISNVTIARADREAPVFLGVANGASERQVFTAAKRSLVPKEELLQFEGLVLEVLPDACYEFGSTMNTSLLPTLAAE